MHIVQRGHNRGPCFFAPEDYLAYLHWLNEALITHDAALHAYALMTNHVHLLLTPACASDTPRLVISLGRRYVQYINRRYRRTGTLWDSRYRSSLVQADSYLLLCQRYIELNPVRAAMVADPMHYRWSSYHANALGLPDPLLTPHSTYKALGTTPAERQRVYWSLCRSGIADDSMTEVRLALRQNQPLGNANFLSRIECALGGRREPRPRGRPRKTSESAPSA